MSSSNSPGSIPGYRPGPILNGPRRAFLAAVFVIPIGTYIYLRTRQTSNAREQRLLEEEGRRNWIEAESNKHGKDLSVKVNRSGGGI